MITRDFSRLVLALVAAIGSSNAIGQTTMFWTDVSGGTGIHRINRHGSDDAYLLDVTDLAEGFEAPWLNNIAVDGVHGKIYWVAWYSTGKIERSDFDGSNRETVVPLGIAIPGDVVLNPELQQLFWNSGQLGIQRMNYDGSGQTTIVPAAMCASNGMAAYLRGQKLFWIGPMGILRANLDGSDVATIVSDPGANPWDIAVDPSGRRIYWTVLGGGIGQGSLRSADFDGGDVQILLSLLHEPSGIAVEPVERRLYWAEMRAGLWRSDMYGNNPEQLHWIEEPMGIALDSAPAEPAVPVARGWALALTAVLAAAYGAWATRKGVKTPCS